MGLSAARINEIQGRVRLLFEETDNFRHIYHFWRGDFSGQWSRYVVLFICMGRPNHRGVQDGQAGMGSFPGL
jgi:hypothetical protein